MIKKIILIFFTIFIPNLSHSDGNNQLLLHKNPINRTDFELTDLEKNKINISSLKQKIVLVNFWATWCPPCVKEIPSLLKLREMYEDKIEIIFISVDSKAAKVVPTFWKKNNFKSIKTYEDSKLGLSKKLEVKIMPTTLIFNEGRHEIARIVGYIDWLSADTLSVLDSIL